MFFHSCLLSFLRRSGHFPISLSYSDVFCHSHIVIATVIYRCYNRNIEIGLMLYIILLKRLIFIDATGILPKVACMLVVSCNRFC